MRLYMASYPAIWQNVSKMLFVDGVEVVLWPKNLFSLSSRKHVAFNGRVKTRQEDHEHHTSQENGAQIMGLGPRRCAQMMRKHIRKLNCGRDRH